MSNGRDVKSLKIELQKIWIMGGIDAETYRAVADWRKMIHQNDGQFIAGPYIERDWPQMVDSLMPLLSGVEDAETKATMYFRDFKSSEINDPKFKQRAKLWEVMGMYMDQGGIIIKGNKPSMDVAGVVLGVIRQLRPEIIAEVGEDPLNRA